MNIIIPYTLASCSLIIFYGLISKNNALLDRDFSEEEAVNAGLSKNIDYRCIQHAASFFGDAYQLYLFSHLSDAHCCGVFLAPCQGSHA